MGTLLVLLLLSLGPRVAVPVDLELHSRQEAPISRVATVRADGLAPTAEASAGLPPEIWLARADVPGATTLLLAPGRTHRITLEGEGVWAPPVTVPAHAVGRTLHVAASGAGDLRFALVNGTGQSLDAWPEAVRARFQMVESPLAVPVSASFERACPVTKDEEGRRWLACSLPEGVLDLRLEANEFIPEYRWGLRILPGTSVEGGEMMLERGASLVGSVMRDDGEVASGAEVALEPTVGDSVARATLGARIDALTFRAVARKRGFFQIRGIPSGSYTLRVRLREYGVLDVPGILVSDPVEQRLDAPFTVPFFPAATVAIAPATAPGGRLWSVRLFRPDTSPREAETDAFGEAVFDLLPAGDYLVMVDGGSGQPRTARPATFSPETPRARVELAEVPVVGRVTLGGEPLSASLYFGGKHGVESVALESDEAGELVGLLPREGVWSLEIRSDEPKVRWMTRDLPVEIDPGLGAAELTIDLPGTSIAGRVVEADRGPAPGAQVILQAAFREGGLTQVEAAEDGTFSIEGQVFGEYQIKAIGAGQRSSAVSAVRLSEDEQDATVELVLEEARQLRGRIVSRDGRGVPGAAIQAVRASSSAGMSDFLIPTATTGPDGWFDLRIPAGGVWSGVAVLPPGHVLAVEPIPPLDRGDEWTIAVAQSGGGNLVLAGTDRQGEPVFPVTTLDARWVLDAGVLTRWAQVHGAIAEAGSLVVPDLPPGSYRVCLAGRESDTPCRTGFLSAGSQLTLDLEERDR